MPGTVRARCAHSKDPNPGALHELLAFTATQMRTLLGWVAVFMAMRLVGAGHEAALSPRVTEPSSDLPGSPCILLLHLLPGQTCRVARTPPSSQTWVCRESRQIGSFCVSTYFLFRAPSVPAG